MTDLPWSLRASYRALHPFEGDDRDFAVLLDPRGAPVMRLQR
jgi:hypothetical protein